jgi:dTDP-glucose 4,6-dehydratase
MRYVVIGSNCFTGSHLVDALVADPGNEVTGISRSPEYAPVFLPYKHRSGRQRFVFHQLDIVRNAAAVLALLDEIEPEVVINAAALSEVGLSNHRPNEYFDVNTAAVVGLCNHLRNRAYLQHYVHVSSAEIFGSCDEPADEATRFNPSTPYAVSKAAADMYLRTIERNFGFPVITIRSTNVYGRYQQLYKIIPRTVIYLKQGRTIELHNGGRATKSFIHVRDVVRGTLMAIQHGAPGAYHLSVPSTETVAEVVARVCETLGYDARRATRAVGERLGQDTRYWLDCSKAERVLGWRPEVPFTEGLAEVIDWIERNWNEVAAQPLEYVHQAA